LPRRDGRIARISTHYNLKDWIAQVSESGMAAALDVLTALNRAGAADIARLRIAVFRDFPSLRRQSRL
jgi:hypothetical protein